MNKFARNTTGPAEGFTDPRCHRATSGMSGCQVANAGLVRETIYRRVGELALGR